MNRIPEGLPTELSAEQFRFNPPEFDENELQECLKAGFNITGKFKQLHGERDQNVRVTSAEGVQYVLKISGTEESPDLIDFQIKALEHVRKTTPSLPVPRHIRSKTGAFQFEYVNNDGDSHTVRVLTYLHGEPLSTLESPSDEILQSIGRLIGHLSCTLADFSHPAESHFMPWGFS